ERGTDRSGARAGSGGGGTMDMVAGLGCTGWPSTVNAKLVMVVSRSVLTVACRSNFWPTKNRAIMGAAWPELNSSLGGVKRDTVGAASAVAASTAATVTVSH